MFYYICVRSGHIKHERVNCGYIQSESLLQEMQVHSDEERKKVIGSHKYGIECRVDHRKCKV